MRYVIYILVVANCLFFAWQMTGDVSEAGLVRSLPPLPPGVHSLTTLQERDPGAGPTEVSGIEEQILLQPPGAGRPLGCHALGPFMLKEEIRAATARLRELGLDPKARTSEVQKQTGYWVYLPTLGYKQALHVVEVLKENSIEDYFIGAGDFVSLGIFSELASANRHRERIRKLGLEPLVEPRYSTRTVHWLDLENVEQSAGQEILKEYPEVRSQELACR